MSSNSFLSLEEYLVSVEEKRNVELRRQLLEIDEAIKKLRERRADVLKTIRDTSLKIDYFKRVPRLNKSLLDIPHLAWRHIQQCCIREQNNGILDVCLASPELDKIIKGDSVADTLRLTGEKVFRILLEKSYLDKNDVENCLNSNARDLERFAGSTWIYENRNEKEEVMFLTSEEITDFAKIVNERKQKWKLFAFKSFTFSAVMSEYTPNYDEFWKAALTFIKTFGNFLLWVSLEDEFGGDRVKSIYRDWLQQLPRIKTFQVDIQAGLDNELSSNFTITSDSDHGGNYSLDFLHNANFSCPFLEDVGPQCQTWYFQADSLAQVSPEQLSPKICRNLKVLELGTYWDTNVHDSFRLFMDADLSNFANVISLVVRGGLSQGIDSAFALLEKFPRVKTVEFCGCSGETPEVEEEDDYVPPTFTTFPTVTKLTLNTKSGCLPLPLDRIPQLLPSLTQLTIKMSYHKAVFAFFWDEEVPENFKQQNKLIDLYQIYGEGRSILESNIWQYMPNLARIIVETEAEWLYDDDGNQVLPRKKNVMTEIFVRPKY